MQLPRESRYITKIQPAGSWGWDQTYKMLILQQLRILVWAKTEDATKKSPQHRPKEYIGPSYIIDEIEKARQQAEDQTAGSRNEKLRGFDSTEELDEYLARPRVDPNQAKDPTRIPVTHYNLEYEIKVKCYNISK